MWILPAGAKHSMSNLDGGAKEWRSYILGELDIYEAFAKRFAT